MSLKARLRAVAHPDVKCFTDDQLRRGLDAVIRACDRANRRGEDPRLVLEVLGVFVTAARTTDDEHDDDDQDLLTRRAHDG